MPYKNRQDQLAYMRDVWYPKNRKFHIGLNKANKLANKKINTLWINEYKELQGCIDCGISNPIVLDFDHVRGQKLFSIASRMEQKREILEKEIQKCEVRCSNCHRIVTHARRSKASINQLVD